MTVGKVVLEIIKYFISTGTEVIDILQVDSNKGVIVIPDGQIVCTKVDSTHYNIEIHSDRVYAGVERCSEDETDAVLSFLTKRFEKMKEIKDVETIKKKKTEKTTTTTKEEKTSKLTL